MSEKDPLVLRLKDTIILISWIGGLILIGGLSWFLTRSLRADLLQNAVNRALAEANDSRRLEASVPPGTSFGRMGHWYSLKEDSGRKFLIFTLMADQTVLPCAAQINSRGKVEEIIPLAVRGSILMDRISPGLVDLYKRRIEGEP